MTSHVCSDPECPTQRGWRWHLRDAAWQALQLTTFLLSVCAVTSCSTPGHPGALARAFCGEAGCRNFGRYYGRPDLVAYDRCIAEGYSTLECRREAREVADQAGEASREEACTSTCYAQGGGRFYCQSRCRR